jgi:hypothetical protein
LAVTARGEPNGRSSRPAVWQGGRRDGCFRPLSRDFRRGLASNAASPAARSPARPNRTRRHPDSAPGSMPPMLRVGRRATRVEPPAGRRDRASLAMRVLQLRVGHLLSTAAGLGRSRHIQDLSRRSTSRAPGRSALHPAADARRLAARVESPIIVQTRRKNRAVDHDQIAS